MTRVRVLRVFTDDAGKRGNSLGVVQDAGGISQARRRAIASKLGYSETVFVEDGARIQIFTPATELRFAGHPLVGSAWLLRTPLLHPPAGAVRTRVEGNRALIIASAEWSPEFERRQLKTPAAVDALSPPARGNIQAWAWQDESECRSW